MKHWILGLRLLSQGGTLQFLRNFVVVVLRIVIRPACIRWEYVRAVCVLWPAEWITVCHVLRFCTCAFLFVALADDTPGEAGALSRMVVPLACCMRHAQCCPLGNPMLSSLL